MVTDGCYTFQGEQFLMHINDESLCCTPEANTVCQLYFNNFLKTKYKR